MLDAEVCNLDMVGNSTLSLFLFQDEDFRPATEVFGKGGGMDLDYLNQVRVETWTTSLPQPQPQCQSLPLFLNQHGSGSSSVSHLARQSLYQKVRILLK